ncbi:response regulator [Flavobacterium agrisoli]|uniref:Response regulator transcription factor n=1 Tax=Flavobacterium agrisoli TaxID=2793066 RepID=A0A934PM00_9FLAO|nr:response regulator transcription factor [Flavobacterium agrisoli]MBK0370647.1 response regulator transcription factor [Flavobacterium agrisoli]
MKPIRLLIADDHTMFLDGISALLDKEKNIQIVGKAENGLEAVTLLTQHTPHLVILDVSMPEMDGIALVKHIKKSYPEMKTLVVSTHSNKQTISRLIRLGVNGYLLKNAAKDTLINAIYSIMDNMDYFPADVYEIHTKNCQQIEKQAAQTVELSNREKEILQLIAQEFTATEIADKTFISLNTVNTHRKNLLSKLNAKNTAGLVKFAIENGLID